MVFKEFTDTEQRENLTMSQTACVKLREPVKDMMDPDRGLIAVVIVVWCTQVNSDAKCAHALQSMRFVSASLKVFITTCHTATSCPHCKQFICKHAQQNIH